MFTHVSLTRVAVVAPTFFTMFFSESKLVNVGALSIKRLLGFKASECKVELSGRTGPEALAYKEVLEKRISAQILEGVLFGTEVYKIFWPLEEKLADGFSEPDGRNRIDDLSYLYRRIDGQTAPTAFRNEFNANAKERRKNDFQSPPIITSESFMGKGVRQLILYHCTDDFNAFSEEQGSSLSSEVLSKLVWTSVDPEWMFHLGCAHRVEITVDSTSTNFIGLIPHDRYVNYKNNLEDQIWVNLWKNYYNDIQNGESPQYPPDRKKLMQNNKAGVASANFTVVLPAFQYEKTESFDTDMGFRDTDGNIYHPDDYERQQAIRIKKVTKIKLIKSLIEDEIARSWHDVAHEKDHVSKISLNQIQSYVLDRSVR